jgi:hypothetical protein
VLETPDIRPFIRGTNSFKGLKPRRLRTSTTRVFGALDSGGNICWRVDKLRRVARRSGVFGGPDDGCRGLQPSMCEAVICPQNRVLVLPLRTLAYLSASFIWKWGGSPLYRRSVPGRCWCANSIRVRAPLVRGIAPRMGEYQMNFKIKIRSGSP